jgi:hypothetical protein
MIDMAHRGNCWKRALQREDMSLILRRPKVRTSHSKGSVNLPISCFRAADRSVGGGAWLASMITAQRNPQYEYQNLGRVKESPSAMHEAVDRYNGEKVRFETPMVDGTSKCKFSKR